MQQTICNRIYYTVADCCYVIKKTKKPKHRLRRALIISAIVFVVLMLYYFVRVVPVMLSVIEEKAKMQISKSIDDCASVLVVNMSYDDYIIIRTDKDGNVSFLGANSVSMNIFARKVTVKVREELESFVDQGITVPFGTMSGMPIFSNVGGDVSMRVLSLSVVSADFSSSFTSAGINQTLHRLYLNIEVSANIIIPGYVKPITSSSEILIGETVIVGKIPNVYLNLK